MTDDFFRARLDQMIDLRHPLAVLARRMPWGQLEAILGPTFQGRDREGRVVAVDDLFGPSLQTVGGGVSAAGRPRLPIRLMASLLYLKHAFNLSDEAVVERWHRARSSGITRGRADTAGRRWPRGLCGRRHPSGIAAACRRQPRNRSRPTAGEASRCGVRIKK